MARPTTVVQTRIDPNIRDKASAVLAEMGLTVSDAMRIVLTRTASEGRFPAELVSNTEEYDAWFRNKVMEALADERDLLPHEAVKARFAARRRQPGSAP